MGTPETAWTDAVILAELNRDNENACSRVLSFLMFGQTVFYAFTGCKREDFFTSP